MKKVFSFVAVALLTVSVLFTACRDTTTVNEGAETTTPVTTPAPDAQHAVPAESAPAGQLAPATDTTSQQAQ